MPYSRNMSNVYWGMTDKELRVLRSKKVLKLDKIGGYNSWFARRDRETLAGQIMQIDAVLEARAAQQNLF